MTFPASARPVDGSLRHEIEVGRHPITTDEPIGRRADRPA
jgi:hypothetical protein